jgi:hypothetical protein
MQELINNELTHDGMRRVKVIGDVVIDAARYEHLIPMAARDRVVCVPGCDDILGLYSLEMTWPIHEPWNVAYLSPKKFRRFFFVHYVYAERVSQCIELARDAFFIGTHHKPGYVFVASMPKSVEAGKEVHGCLLFEAEWMPAQCVATGGFDA